eukprot:CAMPEP_0203778854 /NCGR_PEP_ID=MMETSP0099_2-20121227/8287_1 /ASSEMBLY_ACC=CAM_ASM_000209 /TAXON_ID=96639 /ORGANISM=" , Strain NY0313808BC1" /LENGTH=258 /DNA_ID=CAMNT_0050678527 /DNA_START=113 /DNA_END=889 /DNA_ORIENTATION=+
MFFLVFTRINRYLVETLMRKKNQSKDVHHVVTVIGDGIAEGFGEKPTIGRVSGIGSHLMRRFSEDDKVRHFWEVLNLGHFGATSKDWTPDHKEKPACLQLGVKATLWKDMLQSNKYTEADILVLIVGSMDKVWQGSETPEGTMENLLCIVKELTRRGKVVVVCPVIVGTSAEHNFSPKDLRKAFDKTFPENDGDKIEDTKIIRGPDLNELFSRRADLFSKDGVHLNAKGYQLYSHHLFECLAPKAISMEWKTNQRAIS